MQVDAVCRVRLNVGKEITSTNVWEALGHGSWNGSQARVARREAVTAAKGYIIAYYSVSK